MTLEMRGICKSFGSNDVLKHVDFSIQGGEMLRPAGRERRGQVHADEHSGRRAARRPR